jgi:hypothetical protein
MGVEEVMTDKSIFTASQRPLPTPQQARQSLGLPQTTSTELSNIGDGLVILLKVFGVLIAAAFCIAAVAITLILMPPLTPMSVVVVLLVIIICRQGGKS